MPRWLGPTGARRNYVLMMTLHPAPFPNKPSVWRGKRRVVLPPLREARARALLQVVSRLAREHHPEEVWLDALFSELIPRGLDREWTRPDIKRALNDLVELGLLRLSVQGESVTVVVIHQAG